MRPPSARKIAYHDSKHGEVRSDVYHWLQDKADPKVIAYLTAENNYYDAVMRPLADMVNELFTETVARIPQMENSVPIQHGNYFYDWRQEKDLQYRIYCRKRADSRSELASAAEEVLLDANQLVEPGEYLGYGEVSVSNDERYLAYLINRDGSDEHTLFIKDLVTGELLPEVIPGLFSDGTEGAVAWSVDDTYLFFISTDELGREYRLWRHELGTPLDQAELLYEERDPRFYVYIYRSQSKRFLFIRSEASTTVELRIIDLANPLAPVRLFKPRRTDVEYQIEHWQDSFMVLTNDGGATNFRLERYSLDDFADLIEVVPYDESRYLIGLHSFRDMLYVSGRADGLTQVWRLDGNELVRLVWDEDVYTVTALPQQDYDAAELVVQFESLITPETAYAIDLETNERKLLQQKRVAGSYDSENYVQRRVFAAAEDGSRIPILLVYHKDALKQGPAPLELYAYGGYCIS